MKYRRSILVAAALVTLVALFALIAPAVAKADAESGLGFRGWGPRLGISINPDQFYFGGHLDIGNLARHVRFQPNAELGFGDHVKLFTLNAEAAYRFYSAWNVWTPYVGGGIGMNFKTVDLPRGGHDSTTDLGINVLGGIERGLASGDRFFIEAKFSLDDVPDAKFGIGWTFFP